MWILIPAYRPDERLVRLVDQLLARDPTLSVVVVDDGSGPAYRHVFDTLCSGVTVLRHDRNRGKGAALRTGFDFVAAAQPTSGVVTADADGQHAVGDILAVAAQLRAIGPRSRTLVLGCRAFTGDVPSRSRWGNRIARGVFRLVTRRDVTDTQTGLRGIPPAALEFVAGIPGDGFDYELRMLLDAEKNGFDLSEVPIETIYLDGNSSSHFRPVADSVRVLRPVLRFAGSSLIAFAIDLAVLWAIVAAGGSLLIAVIGARLLSATVNFAVNRGHVFGTPGQPPHLRTNRDRRRPLMSDALRYAALAGLILVTNYAYLETLTAHGVPLLIAKVATESVLFAVSFQAQKRLVFGAFRGDRDADPVAEARAEDAISSAESHVPARIGSA